MSAAGQHSGSDESARNQALSRPHSSDIVIVDGQQLLYHVTWPCGGDPSVLVASMKARLASLPGECVLVFDRYDNVSPNDHERMRRAGVDSTNYNLAINTLLPSRGAILKNKHNKRQLSRVLSTFNMGAAVTIDTQDTGAIGHDEADVTLISYVLQAVGEVIMWCVCFATIQTWSGFLCTECGGTSLLTIVRYRRSSRMER